MRERMMKGEDRERFNEECLKIGRALKNGILTEAEAAENIKSLKWCQCGLPAEILAPDPYWGFLSPENEHLAPVTGYCKDCHEATVAV